MSRRLPVSLITGFLGSGKSTFLRHVLQSPGFPAMQTALILNDAGPVNIDAKLFKGRAAEVYALTGGCACCVTPQEMIQSLLRFSADPALQQAWIEASGVADTEDLLDRLTDTKLMRHIEISQVVYVLDTANFPRWHPNRWVHQEQVRWADLILLNKTDLCKDSHVRRTMKLLQDWNPNARIEACTMGQADWQPPPTAQVSNSLVLPQQRAHAVFESLWWPCDETIDESLLRTTLARLPSSVVRLKGFLRLTNDPGAWHSINRIGPEAEPMLWKIDLQEPPEAGLILIGNGMDPQLARSILNEIQPTKST